MLGGLVIKKRQTIFQWLKTSYQGIVLLQETHSLEKDEKQWVSEWGGEIIFAYGTSNSRGVAILLDSKCEYIVSDIVRDPNGRFIVLKITLHNESFVIVNVYAPTKDDGKSQRSFFEQMNKMLDSYIGINIIIGGDFNVCLNPNKDKQGGLTMTQSACSKLIQAMSASKDLIDIWRVFNEDAKRFTWCSLTKKGRVSSRLDYWLISSCLLFDIEHTDIDPSIKTDHSIVTLNIMLRKTPERGRGS